MNILFYLALSLFLILSLFLVVFILLQESKTTGLGASFGGDAGGSLFGTSTADVLKKITAWMIGIFLLSSIFLSIWSSFDFAKSEKSNIEQVQEKTPS